eukprot:CAMPEP_0203952532 /NCGR_PEP_ID=MMETSP0359-20131031/86146_1 /ASSEMBLY_ACC=CAM_ASM_000338 /TAXON_ID=268821 /ORGANISM="Scrippsiella Hangoei, Strain SHTV-5" /LENGTH=920 /DNA_ID=CAMNT_0050885545 /DNA_START=64 /DNA_END=2823 /DNA_ORIENTATION=-
MAWAEAAEGSGRAPMDRALVVVRVDAPGVVVRLDPPPDKDMPSARWMERLAALMQPHEGQTHVLSCCVLGSLHEVSSHLWEHQILWMCLQFPGPGAGGGGGPERHVAVHLSELLDPCADLSAGTYESVVGLEEEALDGSGEISVGLSLATLRGDAGPPPSLQVAFALYLEVAQGASEVVAAAAAEAEVGRGLRLRCAGVEQPIQQGMRHTLVLTESWAEVPQALMELSACVQVPVGRSHDFTELPLDLSTLCSAVRAGGSDSISAEVCSQPLPSVGRALRLRATVRSLRWPGQAAGQCSPGVSKDTEIWASGIDVGARVWRISIELRSIRLLARTANVFAMYSHEFFQQPRPFRTNPPTLARKNTTVYLPHAFASYTMSATEDEVREQLEEALRVELWYRDVYKKDGPLGVVDVNLAPVLDQSLQHSAGMPSMVQGFRVFDQICPVISSDTQEPQKVGALRLLVFLEDLGSSASSPAAAAAMAQGTPSAWQGGGGAPDVGGLGRTDVKVLATAPQTSELCRLHPSAAFPSHAPDSARQSPMYATAYELEIWKRSEEDKFRVYLSEQEADLRERLEDEYSQRELARASDFRQTQLELRAVEAKVRRKLQELQHREVALAAEEARVAALRDEIKGRTDMAIQGHEDAARRRVTEAHHALELARSRNTHLEERVQELESDLGLARQRLFDLETELEGSKLKLQNSPLMQMQLELQATQLQLREQQGRTEGIAESREHFRRKVEELCGRLASAPVVPAASSAVSSARLPPPPQRQPPPRQPETAAPEAPMSARLPPSAVADMSDVTQALRKIQVDLAQLAQDWTAEPPFRESASASACAATPLSAQRSGPAGAGLAAPGAASCGDPREELAHHLEWLHGQKEELLESGLYDAEDAVLQALDARIAEAALQLGLPVPGRADMRAW